MRAAFLTADVLAAEPNAAAALRTLHDSGLSPVILLPHPLAEGERLDLGGFPHVACPPDEPECWGRQPDLFLDAATEAGVAVGEAFLVCREADDVAKAATAGCRPVLVLSSRNLDAVYGPAESEHKEAATAIDLEAAVRYMCMEAEQERALGPFAFAPHPVLDEVPRPNLSSGDITRIFLLVTVAGVALSLGIAYLLAELYRTIRLDGSLGELARLVTLQWIPQTWRGVLFMVLGVAVGLAVPRALARMRARRPYHG